MSMKRTLLLLPFLFLFFLPSFSQPKLMVFLDCSNTGCDWNYIRTELPVVNYSRDRIASDVHVLITNQWNGSGGREYQMIFYGQNEFASCVDTISYKTKFNSTEFELRQAMVTNLKVGLVPFLIKNGQLDLIKVEFGEVQDTTEHNVEQEDPWNYWSIRLGANGNIGIDQNYTSTRLGGSIRSSQVTDEKKVVFSVFGNENNSEYTYVNDSGFTEKTLVINHEYGFDHMNIWSMGEKWALGYEVGYFSNTFNNFKNVYYASPSIEYNLFPYSDVNNKMLTLRYGIGASQNEYIDTTLYNKTAEFVGAEYLSLTSRFNQKWGNIETRLKYQHYFHDLALNNLSFNSDIEVRVTGGLSFNIYLWGALVHDQIYLPKGDANAEQVLTRQRALASSFNFRTYFGFNYRFGSKLNNFVNPRFGSRGF
ncbi:MAG: hypothetical protein OEY56_02855 [Cyclobacteriaceae bacterium]|nr:hypothetical protein [Cyclobacteriaceae bacterium]